MTYLRKILMGKIFPVMLGVIFYKFAYTYSGGVNWENNPPTGSGNYEQPVTATDITNAYTIVPQRGYNNATLATVVNQESVIRFIVNMDGAVDGNGIAFTSVDNVTIAGANLPLQWPDGGWPDSDEALVIFMVDDGTNGDDTAASININRNEGFENVEI